VTDTDKLEPGWYWVKAGGEPEIARYRPEYGWRFSGDRVWYNPKTVSPAIIGPRLTPPGEG